MPNVASVLKEEIARVARKEIRASTDSLAAASSRYRSDIAILKKKITELERAIAKLQKGSPFRSTPPAPDGGEGSGFRFSAKSMLSQRKRLGLSAADVGKLLGVSGQSVYKWEEGTARPRKTQFAAIASMRQMGRREAAKKLAAVNEAGAQR